MKKMILASAACIALAITAQALELGGERLKGRPPETLLVCGGGSVWMIDPDGKVYYCQVKKMEF